MAFANKESNWFIRVRVRVSRYSGNNSPVTVSSLLLPFTLRRKFILSALLSHGYFSFLMKFTRELQTRSNLRNVYGKVRSNSELATI